MARFEPELIRHAVLRELNRGGQIFFVHNRVEDIEILARRLRQIVPEANLAVAHGQMHENDLERVMLDFIDRRYDLLLATTIVESGLDIPNANTIFIDEADRYGLADLHQLRGRVGRYKHRAYCCLLIDPNKNLSPSAAKRLRAIEEFSDMGAGFAIAMRDLEIRGAGNILGTEQSGHIATIGYELYCNLLEHAVRQAEAVAAEDFDRGRRRPARRGLHPPLLRARHAAEDRPLSPAGPGVEPPRAGRFPGGTGGPFRAAPPVGAASLGDGGDSHCRPPLADHLDSPRGPVRGIHVLLGPADPAVGGPERGRLRVVDAQSAYLPLDKEVAPAGIGRSPR